MIPDDMLGCMTIGDPVCRSCGQFVSGPHYCTGPMYPPIWPTEFKFDTKRPFNAAREPVGTVVKMNALIHFKADTDKWIVEGIDKTYSDSEVQNIFDEDTKDFTWINYVTKTREQVLTDLLQHGSVEIALEELQYCG